MLLIPAIDIKDGKCVRLRQGDMNQSTVFSDDPVAMAARWVEEGARRIHIVDLDGRQGVCLRAQRGEAEHAKCCNQRRAERQDKGLRSRRFDQGNQLRDQ